MIERIIAYPTSGGDLGSGEWRATYAEAREYIVRCRDCEHMHTVRSWLGMDVDECWLHADPGSGALGKEPTEPDGFCAWGERRDDGREG